MSSPWFRMDSTAWRMVREHLAKPWPFEAAVADLRYLDNERRTGRSFPGRPTLCKDWGWKDWDVRKLLCAEDLWRDSFTSDSPAFTSDPPAAQRLKAPYRAKSSSFHQRSTSDPPSRDPILEQEEQKNTDPGPPGPASEADSDRGGRASPQWVADLWSQLEALRSKHEPGARALDLTTYATALRSTVKALGPDREQGSHRLLETVRWWYTSPAAAWHREHVTGSKAVKAWLRPSKAVPRWDEVADWLQTVPAASPELQASAAAEVRELLELHPSANEARMEWHRRHPHLEASAFWGLVEASRDPFPQPAPRLSLVAND